MAGTLIPTLVLLVIVAADAWQHFYFEVSSQFVIPLASAPLERALLFPMAIVPNAWGVWNVLHLRFTSRLGLSLGLHGSLLVLLLMPGGVLLARLFDVFTLQWQFVLPMAPIGMAIYYLAWKFGVGFLNRELGISAT
jgi:hypothetical protein